MDPLLDDPQIALLCELVEASRRLPTDGREEFIAFHVMGADPRIPVRHGGFPGDHYWAHPQDLEVLRQADLITVTNANESLLIFFVNPRGFRHYEHIKRSTGAPVERVEGEVRRLLASEQFQQAHKVAYAKWAKAEALLWGAARLNTVARLRAVLHVAGIGSVTERDFLEALVAYWGTVSDLVQRQEHGGQKDGRPVTWEDARRAGFQVMIAMYEVTRSLERRAPST